MLQVTKIREKCFKLEAYQNVWQQKLNNLMALNVHKYKLDDLDLSASLNEFVLYKEVNTETAYLESFECKLRYLLFFSLILQ